MNLNGKSKKRHSITNRLKWKEAEAPHYSWTKSPPPIYSDTAVSYKFLDKIASHQLWYVYIVQSISYLLLCIYAI